MGREARAVKYRYCPTCKQDLRASSKKMIEHSTYCKRLEKLNLINPESERKLLMP